MNQIQKLNRKQNIMQPIIQKASVLLSRCTFTSFRSNIGAILIWLFLLAQVLFIIYLNLFESPTMIDYDGAKLYKHAIEIWKEKTFLLPDWKYITTMELDCSLLPALLFYGITGNIFLSFGLSNILILFVFLFVVYMLIKRTACGRYAPLALSIILIPFEMGMLAYLNMLFFNGAQYGIKVLIPLLFLLLLTTPDHKRKTPGTILGVLLYSFLLFLTSFSSGVYVMMCGIAPLIAGFLIQTLLNGKLQRENFAQTGLCILSGVCFLAGSLLSSLLDISAKGNTMLLTKAENFQMNLNACFLGLFQTLRAMGSADIPVLSVQGIAGLLRIGLTLALLFVALIQWRKFFAPSPKLDVKKLLSLIFLWNLLILIFIDTRYSPGNLTMEYRYYLIAYIPLMILFAIQMGEWLDSASFAMKRTMQISLAGAVLILWGGCVKSALEYRGISEYANEITAYIGGLEQEVDSVFFLPDEQAPEICRLLDDTRTYCSYGTGGGLVVNDYYHSYIDRSSHGDRNLLFVYDWETPDQYLPYYISSQYEKIGTVRWFDVYYSEKNLFDSTPGFPTGEASIDYFYTPGYITNSNNSVLDENGFLAVNGNGEETVNSGLLAAYSGSCRILLSYETDPNAAASSIGTFEIRDQDKTVYTAEISGSGQELVISDFTAELEAPSIHITINNGVSCKLKSLSFQNQ